MRLSSHREPIALGSTHLRKSSPPLAEMISYRLLQPEFRPYASRRTFPLHTRFLESGEQNAFKLEELYCNILEEHFLRVDSANSCIPDQIFYVQENLLSRMNREPRRQWDRGRRSRQFDLRTAKHQNDQRLASTVPRQVLKLLLLFFEQTHEIREYDVRIQKQRHPLRHQRHYPSLTP